MTHNSTGQVVSLYAVEQLQFDDVNSVSLSTAVSVPAPSWTSTSISPAIGSTGSEYFDGDPTVIALTGGGFVVAWADKDGSNNTVHYTAQIYDSNGNMIDMDFRVWEDHPKVYEQNHNTDAATSPPSITALHNGGEVDEVRQVVDLDPRDGLFVFPVLVDLANKRAFGGDFVMAPHALIHTGYAR